MLRVRAALDGYIASHGRDVQVSAAHIRDLLNPRGLWSLDPRQARAEQEKPPELPPGADPLTGCMPVTPSG